MIQQRTNISKEIKLKETKQIEMLMELVNKVGVTTEKLKYENSVIFKCSGCYNLSPLKNQVFPYMCIAVYVI